MIDTSRPTTQAVNQSLCEKVDLIQATASVLESEAYLSIMSFKVTSFVNFSPECLTDW